MRPAETQTARMCHSGVTEGVQEDRRRRETTTGVYVERLLSGDPPLPHEVWRRTRGLYRAAVYHAPTPARITLERIRAERVELYRTVPPRR